MERGGSELRSAWDWRTAADDTPQELYAHWQEAVIRSRALFAEAVAEGGPERHPGGPFPSLRYILVNMIEEYPATTGTPISSGDPSTASSATTHRDSPTRSLGRAHLYGVRVNSDVAVGIIMLVGLAGTVIPFLPGLPVIIAAALIWVLADGSDPGEWIVFAVVAAVALAGMLAGSIVPARRASRAGASPWVLAAGVVGLIGGAIAIPIVGALIGWPVGIWLGEWMRTRDRTTAWATTRATIVGVGLSVALQFGAGVLAVAIWAVAAARW